MSLSDLGGEVAEELRIGDYITLKCVKADSFMYTEGILLEDLLAKPELSDFEDNLFCVHLQRQYSASRELEEFTEANNLDAGIKITDKSTLKILNALKRGKKNEDKLNERYMHTKTGHPVLFGDIIQLLHVKSGKYITVVPDQLARDERENIRTCLSSGGNPFSWLQLLPRYKIDREGDRILSSTEAYLKVSERPNEFIHCSDKDPIAGIGLVSYREINCSLENTSWRLNKFQSSTSLIDKNVLLPGQLVSIQEPESQSNILVFSKLQTVEAAPPNQLEAENSVTSFKMATSGDVVFLPEDEECFNSNVLWVIESKTLTTGGPVAWKSDPVRFRHFNTGVYLTMEPSDSDVTHMVTSSSSATPGTLFNVYEQNSTSTTLTNAKAVQFNQGPFWVKRGDVDATGSYECKGSRDKSHAINLLIHHYSPGEEPEDDDEESSMKKRDTLDVYVGMSSRNYMIRYLDRTVIPNTPVWTVSTIWPGGDVSEMTAFQLTCVKVINFLKGYPVNADADQLQEAPDLTVRSSRQLIAREQGLLQIVMRLLEVLAPISAKEIVTPPPVSRSPNKKKANEIEGAVQSDDEKAFIRMGQLMVKEVLNILLCILEQDISNQLMVADQMPVLLAHVGPQPLAARCVTEMLDKNIKLQETKIGAREINIFTDKLRSSQMNSMYLNLLKATCSCEKKGVVNNQVAVAEALFSDMNDIIIQVVPDYTHSFKVEWFDEATSLYIPSAPDSSAPILGSDLVYKGIPRLSLSWTSKSIDCSPLGLFGKLAIGVEDLYNTVSAMSTESFEDSYFPSKESQSSSRRAAVADYFISQLYLAAELCLDRNYIAMAKLESVFPYDILVSLIKIDGGGDSVKAAAVKLLLCLHVDRDPQNASQVPCLSRCWSDVARHETPALPCVEHIRHLEFALLQQYISDHLRAMSGVRWSSLSFHVVSLLNQLIQFNFYGNVDKVNDVVSPLIQALDRRKMKIAQKVIPSSKNLKRGISRRGKSVRSKSMANLNAPSSIDSASGMEGGSAENSDEKLVNPDEIDAGAIDESTWQFKMLNILESIAALAFILMLVFVAIAVAVYEAVEATTPELEIFGLFITGTFLLELVSRGYCHWYVRKDWYMKAFVSNYLNVIDIIVVLIDLIILGLPDTGGGTGFTKALRAARLVRLVRVLKAARIVSNLTSTEEEDKEAYKHPPRFLKTPEIEIDTMVESMRLLNYVQKLIEDRNLSLFLRAFMLWENGQEKRTPAEIFESVAEKFPEFNLGEESVDDIFIDLIMYQSSELVQVVLDVLVSFHSTKYTLISNVKNMQLIVSPEGERQFRYIEQMLLQLERNAETHELWGRLLTQDDIQKNRQTKDYLSELVDLCRTRCTVLKFNQDYEPVKEVQDMLRNFGFYDIIFKVLNLVSTIKHDEDITVSVTLSDEHANTRDLVYRANELMYWFLLDNPLNQDQIFEELDFFLSSLDRNINSHNVVKAIFSNNEKLMHLVQNSLIEDFAEKICKNGRRPQYLSLLGAILNVGEKNMLENQFDTVKHLIAPARLKKMCQYICPINHAEYEQKVAQMKPLLNVKDISMDDLPDELHYHLAFIDVLSGCTVGRVNVTTVEAKVQSVYSFVDILDAMTDPRSLLLVNIGLGLFLFNSFIETEMMVGGLESSAAMWKFIKSTVPIFKAAPDEFKNIENNGWFAESVCRQKIEYIIVCVMCIEGFFARYYDPNVMKSDEAGLGADVVQMNPDEVQALVSSLSEALVAMHECKPKCLSEEHNVLILHAVEALHRSMGTEYVDISPEEPSKVMETAEEEDEESISAKLKEFIEEIAGDESVLEGAKEESTPFISRIEKLPFIKDDVKEGGDVRYEPFIQKLVSHVRQRFQMIDGEKFLDARCTKTTTWLIKAFRTMIENRWGMSIDERDDDGGEEQDIASEEVVNALNKNGATVLCLELICVGIDSELMLEAVKLCVAMLFREGGSLAVQETMYNYLSKNNSTLFFKQLRLTIQKLISWHKWHQVIELPEGEDPDLPEDVIAIRFMQLMCEGHYLNNQNILREQPENDTSINLLDDYVAYLNTVSRLQCRTSTDAASRVASTILEVIQGPCVETQEYFVLNTELIETLNRIMRSKVVLDCVAEEELELKKAAIDILQGLLEGQGKKKTVYERVLSVIHIDIVQMMSKPDESEGAEQSEEAIVLQSECLVFLQMLCDYRPSLRAELGYDSADVTAEGAEVACVEVMWNGELQRRFFRVPEICQYLAKSSKDDLVENVDRSNQENKLIDFVERSHNLYKEIKHQEKLVAMGISAIFSRTNQDMATWTAFFLACIINLMLLTFYVLDNGSPVMPQGAKLAVDILNILQIFFAGFTLVLFIVVRVPVQFEINMSSGESLTKAVILTALDPLTVYYVVYLIISILGVFSSDLFSTLLLLDIVMKNSTTRDVLNAVVYPRKQLGMTVVLGIFVAYIFSFIIFFYYRDEFIEDAAGSCQNLWGCMKVVTGYGLRMGGGVGDMMSHTVGERWVVDMLYYVLIIIILLNVVFGIIIDTFSDMRSQKLERQRDTTETCFICGIDKQVFDRASDANNGFKLHIKGEQNMWNYFYFILYIWEQDKDDDDGLEYFVRHCIEDNDIKWFPINKAMSLNNAEDESDTLYGDIQGDIHSSESKVLAKLDHFNGEVNNVLDRIMFSLSAEEKSRRDSVSGGGSLARSATMSRGRSVRDNGDGGSLGSIRSRASTAPVKKPKALEAPPLQESVSLSDGLSNKTPRNVSYKILLLVMEINGLEMNTPEMESVFVRVASESGPRTIYAHSTTSTKVLFDRRDKTFVQVSSAAKVDEGRSCRIQVMQSAGRITNFLAKVDVAYADMIQSNNKEIVKYFTPVSHQSASECSLKILVKTYEV